MGELVQGQVLAVCISEVRGIAKHPVESIHLIPGHGIQGTPTRETGTGRSVCWPRRVWINCKVKSHYS